MKCPGQEVLRQCWEKSPFPRKSTGKPRSKIELYGVARVFRSNMSSAEGKSGVIKGCRVMKAFIKGFRGLLEL